MITPGPWDWRNDQLIRYNEGGGITPIGIGAGNAITNCEPTLDDRAVISAAPDLLEAAKRLMEYYVHCLPDHMGNEFREAIAKAEDKSWAHPKPPR